MKLKHYVKREIGKEIVNMSSFKTYFQQGDNFKNFVAQGETEEIAAVEKIQQKLHSGDVISPEQFLKLHAVTQQVNLLVVGEMFCPDCHVNISAFNAMCHMSHITEQQTNINMAIISREYAQKHLLTALELAAIKIPLLITLDDNMQLIHRDIADNLFVERPKSVKEKLDFDEIKPAYLSGEYLADTIDDILEMIIR